jgi:signal transduction histidine kinase
MGTSDDRSGSGSSTEASLRALSEMLTTNRAEILARWRSAVRRRQGEDAAAELSDPVPGLLDRIAGLGPGGDDPLVSPTEVLEQGGAGEQDLVDTVTQLVLLRDQVVELWATLPRGGAAALRLLNRALDGAILDATVRAAQARERLGRALDRLAESGGADDLEVQGEAVLRIVLEEAPSVDGAVLLLPDGDGLRVCAAVGVEAERARGRKLRVGEGLPGAIVTAGGVLQTRWAGDPLDGERKPGPGRAAYGLTLAAPGDGELSAIAYVLSLTAREIPPDDRLLFRAAAQQAAAAFAARRPRATGGDDPVRMRDRALATFAHDVRSPLGVVMMQASVMVKTAGRPDQLERVAHRAASMQRAAQRMERLLADYQSFVEVRSGATTMNHAPLEPAPLLRQTVDALRSLAEERRVVLEAELSAGLPTLVGDKERLQEALEHLVRAALQVVADGGRISLRAQHDDGGVVFSVQDTAPPVDPQDLAGAFDRAWQGERAAIGRGGLGLAVAKGIVEAHGGRIWAVSATGEGNTFCFALPAARA